MSRRLSTEAANVENLKPPARPGDLSKNAIMSFTAEQVDDRSPRTVRGGLVYLPAGSELVTDADEEVSGYWAIARNMYLNGSTTPFADFPALYHASR